MIEKTTPPQTATHPKPTEKPLIPRLQRLLAGQPADDVILDPDNPNLIQERRQDSSQ